MDTPYGVRTYTRAAASPSGFHFWLVVDSYWPAFHLIVGKSRIVRGLDVKDLPPKHLFELFVLLAIHCLYPYVTRL